MMDWLKKVVPINSEILVDETSLDTTNDDELVQKVISVNSEILIHEINLNTINDYKLVEETIED